MTVIPDTLQTIQKFFQEHLSEFPLQKQQHFAERMYRVFGDDSYFPLLQRYIEGARASFERTAKILGDAEAMQLAGASILEEMESRLSYNTRLAKRFPFLREHPEFLAYQDFVWNLNKFFEYGVIDEERKNELVNELQQVDWKLYFFDHTFIAVDPVQTTNTVYLLQQLGVIDIVNEFVTLAKKTLKDDDEHAFVNLLYFYTHVIISESRYYQNFVDATRHEDALQYFASTLDRILALTNTDVIAEIGVCYKLLQRHDATVSKIVTKIQETLQAEGGLLTIHGIEMTPDKRYKLEHRNILALMLLAPWSQLRVGPKIYERTL